MANFNSDIMVAVVFCFLFSWFDAALSSPVPFKREFYNPHSITVCRGQMRSIACPNLELIHIFNAFYGKLNGRDCNTAITQKRDNIPTCISRNSPALIKETCHGQQSCDLYAEDALYEDPCPGVTKYLFVSFTCQGKSQLNQKLQNLGYSNNIVNNYFGGNAMHFPNTQMPLSNTLPSIQQRNKMEHPSIARVCTGLTQNILCPSAQLLQIKTAFYGKQQNRDCSGRFVPDPEPTCFSRDTFRAVKNMCEGQQSCDLIAEPDIYGSTTCEPWVQKYLQVDYICDKPRPGIAKQQFNFAPSRFNRFGGTQNAVLRSQLSNSDDPAYEIWKKWANTEEIAQWQRSTLPDPQASNMPWQFSMQIPLAELRSIYPSFDAVQKAEKRADIFQPQYQQIQQLQPFHQQQPFQQQPFQQQPFQQQPFQQQPFQQQLQQKAPFYPSMASYSPSYDFQRAEQRADIVQPSIPQPALPTSYDQAAMGYPQNPARPCEQCNGDCTNYLCYGCGGCPVEPQQKQPHYMYPYQKQDSGYHDAFESHAMDLSGMVLFPFPALPKHIQPKGKQRPGKSNTPTDEDGEDDDDDEDDGDGTDEDDDDNEEDDTVDDESSEQKKKMTKKQKAKKTAKRRSHNQG